MILLTSITSPLLVQKFAPGLKQASDEEAASPLFGRILVPIASPHTQQYLLSLANLLARESNGKVMALNVVRDERGQTLGIQHQKELLERVPELLSDPEAEIELIPRLADTLSQGILHTSIERNISLIIMGWRGKRSIQQTILGTVLDEVIWGSDTPVLIGKLAYPLNGMRRVLLILPAKVLAPAVMRRMLDANFILARALNAPLHILADASYLELVNELIEHTELDQPVSVEKMLGPLRPHELEKHIDSDLLVVPGFGSRQRFLSSVGDLPERLAASFSGNLIILHFDR